MTVLSLGDAHQAHNHHGCGKSIPSPRFPSSGPARPSDPTSNMVASVGLTYQAEDQLKIIFGDDNSWTLVQRSSYKASLKAKRPKLLHKAPAIPGSLKRVATKCEKHHYKHNKTTTQSNNFIARGLPQHNTKVGRNTTTTTSITRESNESQLSETTIIRELQTK
jgi:hypothetical protein